MNILSFSLKDRTIALQKLLLPLSILVSCSLVIFLSLSGRWRYALVIVFLAFFLTAFLGGFSSEFLVASICLISFLEVALQFSLGTARGLSLMNLALGISILLFMINNLKSEKRLLAKCSLNWPLLLLTAYELASLLSTYAQGKYSLPLPELLILFKADVDPFLIFLIAYNLPRSKHEIQALINFLLAFFTAVVVLNIFNYYGLVNFLHFIEVGFKYKEVVTGPYELGLRLTGFFKDPNLFASFIILFLPLTITSLLYTRKKILKLFLSISLFFQLFVLVLSGSRGGYIAFVASVVVLFSILKKTHILEWKHIFLISLFLLGLVLTLALIYRGPFAVNVMERFHYEGDVDLDILTQRRYRLWKMGLSQFLESPLVGVGWKNSIDVHNSFIYYLVTLGIIGFSLFLFIYLKIIRICWKHLQRDRLTYGNYLNLSFLAGFLGILTIMMSLGIYYVYHYLFLYSGLVLKYNKLEDSPGQGYDLGGDG